MTAAKQKKSPASSILELIVIVAVALGLALLIQAFDCARPFSAWPLDLDDASQAYGSPTQQPQTLLRWLDVGPLQLQGLAGAFVDWRLHDDELPLVALLLGVASISVQVKPSHAP